MAHIRLRCYEPAAAGPALIGKEMLERIAALYQIESEIRGPAANAQSLARGERIEPSAMPSRRSYAKGLNSSAKKPNSPRRSATRSRAGRASAASLTMAASRPHQHR